MADDDIQFSENPPAIIDTESIKYLYGSEVDLQDHMMNKMLKLKIQVLKQVVVVEQVLPLMKVC